MNRSIWEVYQDCGGVLADNIGVDQKVTCIFHEDDNPSAKIYASNEKFVCFVCRIVLTANEMQRKFRGENFEPVKIDRSPYTVLDVWEKEMTTNLKKLSKNKRFIVYKYFDFRRTALKYGQEIEIPDLWDELTTLNQKVINLANAKEK